MSGVNISKKAVYIYLKRAQFIIISKEKKEKSIKQIVNKKITLKNDKI